MKMKAAICTLTTVAVREKPSHKSQMTNQLLFGDPVNILDRQDTWLLIEGLDDKYQGWIDQDQITTVSETFLKTLQHETPVYLTSRYCLADSGKNSVLLSSGSRLPAQKNDTLTINNEKWQLRDRFEITSGKQPAEKLITIARQFLNSPYLWGGRSIFGLDCSGFTQNVYRMAGIQLPRDSGDQATIGKTVDFIHEGQPGDLVFFENEEQQIVHVGILLNNNQIIHASGKVRIDTIDHEGIFRKDKSVYSHKLRIIKRVLPS